MGDVTYEKIVRIYVKMRDARSALKAEYEAKDKAIKDQQDELETFLLGEMNSLGFDSFKTAAGTAYRTDQLIPQGADWNVFYDWVAKTRGFDFLFKRIKADAVRDYMDLHNGELPPGVSIFSKLGVGIRRS